ncbi:Uncharacterised protein [Burkholderia pseudomallei]|nr:Uncharacterised protein [Burkholderia pseudomallei]CAJ5061323.1 Uncharacterised protein [Burkholderia pseudomallei]
MEIRRCDRVFQGSCGVGSGAARARRVGRSGAARARARVTGRAPDDRAGRGGGACARTDSSAPPRGRGRGDGGCDGAARLGRGGTPRVEPDIGRRAGRHVDRRFDRDFGAGRGGSVGMHGGTRGGSHSAARGMRGTRRRRTAGADHGWPARVRAPCAGRGRRADSGREGRANRANRANQTDQAGQMVFLHVSSTHVDSAAERPCVKDLMKPSIGVQVVSIWNRIGICSFKKGWIESRGERRARRGMRGDVERECAKAEPSALDAGEAGMCMRRAVRQGRGWKPGRGRTQRAPALRKGSPSAMCPGASASRRGDRQPGRNRRRPKRAADARRAATRAHASGRARGASRIST